MSKHKETLTFNSFSGYYGVVPNGYGGFDWSDIVYFNKGGGAEGNEEGFQSIIKGRGEAGFGPYGGGAFESANLSETFSLKSMLAASGAGTGDPVFFTSYTYSHGKLIEKARDVVYVTPQVQKIDFAKIGGKGDFQNIVAVSMSVGSARYGSHYGHTGIGEGMVFDNMTVQWNGKIPDGKFIPSHAHVLSPYIYSMLAVHGFNADVSTYDASSPASEVSHSGYHTGLTSLDAALGQHPSHTDLTTQFVLPVPEHFGT